MGNILEDERLQNIKQEEKEALEELENLYGGQISSSKELYAAVKDAAAALGKEQAQQLKEQTQLAVEQLQLQKEEAKRDYLQEQSAAYTDFRQQNQLHGVHEEALADGGLRNTGYAETSRVAMYNQYQNRVAAARAGYTAAMTNYDLGIRQAQAQNNALLAQIALDTLQLQLKYALEAFRFESDLQLEKYKQTGQLQEDFLDKYAQQLQLVQREQAGKGSGGPAPEEQPQETMDTVFDVIDLGKQLQQQKLESNPIVQAVRKAQQQAGESPSFTDFVRQLKAGGKGMGGS